MIALAAAPPPPISERIDALLGTRPIGEVADLFCGAGGTSTGALRAIRRLGGELKLVCVNHWQTAIDTHKLNHPYAEHVCQDVDKADPEELVPRGRLHLLCASPECRYYSNARGGKPVSDQGRMSPWQINNWLTKLYVERLLVENVPEFRNWGPICGLLDDHTGEHRACAGPDPEPHCGEPLTREAWARAITMTHSWDAKLVKRLRKQALKYGCPLPVDHDGECDFTVELPPQTCNRPVPGKAGTYFQAWIASLWAMGYDLQWKILNAADFGDATTRRRFFLQARRDGRPIRWPERTHAPAATAAKAQLDGKKLLPYVAARKIIDWTDKGGSIFDRTTPLSLNTRLRMARGLQRFGGPMAPLYLNLLDLPPEVMAKYAKPEAWSPAQRPFLFANRHNNVPTSTDEPIATVTTASGGGSYVVLPEAEPFIVGQHGGALPQSVDGPTPTVVNIARIRLFQPTAEPFVVNRANNERTDGVTGVTDPLPTATTRGAGYLTTPEAMIIPQHAGGIARQPGEPLPTITGDGNGLAEPIILPYHQQSECYPVSEPIKTLATKQDYGLVQPTSGPLSPPDAMLVPYGPAAEARPVSEPTHTIPTRDRLGLAQPMLLNYHGDDSDGSPRAPGSVEDPLSGLHAGGKTHALVEPTSEPFIVPHFNDRPGQAPRIHSIDEPAPTVTSRGAGNLVEPVLIQTDQTGGGQRGSTVHAVDEPLRTVVTKRNIGLVEPALVQLPPGVKVDPRRLVLIDGVLHVLDIRYRMLKNPELARAMGFDDDESRYEFTGTQTEITKQIGNAVPCNLAAALVSACLWDAAAELEERVA